MSTHVAPAPPLLLSPAAPPPVASTRPTASSRPRLALTEPEWITAFAEGVLSGLYIRVIGYLTLLEIELLATLPFRFAAVTRFAFHPAVALFTLLWMGWIGGELFADIVNDNDWSLTARGFARAFFAGFVTLSLLPPMYQKPRLYEAFIAGFPLAHVIGLRFFRSGTYTAGDGETFLQGTDLGWNNWTNYFVAGLLAYAVARFWRSAPWACILATAAIGVLNLALGSRSTGTSQILAAVTMPIVLAISRTGSRTKSKRPQWLKRIKWRTIALIMVATVAAAVTVAKTYASLAESGALGERALAKYQMQNEGGNLMMAGRGEVFIAIAAALDKPFLGHGSWPRDKVGYVERASEMFGFEFDPNYGRIMMNRFIPSHSMLIGAWVEHGILGLLFWAYICYLVARNLPAVPAFLPEYMGVIVLNSFGFAWAVLFSPIQNRAYTATIVVPMLIVQIHRMSSPRTAASRRS